MSNPRNANDHSNTSENSSGLHEHLSQAVLSLACRQRTAGMFAFRASNAESVLSPQRLNTLNHGPSHKFLS